MRTLLAVALFVSCRLGVGTGADQPSESPRTLVSGRDVGEFVPQFYTRVVTGPLMNRSVCYVCRYGERPVAMVLLRKVGPELRPLLKNIDRLVEQHRGAGLRSFGVMVADETFPAVSAVQTFAFNNRVGVPLTVATEAAAGETGQNIAKDAAVTVVFYHKRHVVKRYALRADELDVEHFTPVIEALKEFAAEHAANPVPHDPETDGVAPSEPAR